MTTINKHLTLTLTLLLNKTIKQLKARDVYSLSSPLLFLRNVWGHIVLFFCRRRPEGQRFQPPKASTMCRKTDQEGGGRQTNISNEHNRLKNPNWREADQLAIYKHDRGVELGFTEKQLQLSGQSGT